MTSARGGLLSTPEIEPRRKLICILHPGAYKNNRVSCLREAHLFGIEEIHLIRKLGKPAEKIIDVLAALDEINTAKSNP